PSMQCLIASPPQLASLLPYTALFRPETCRSGCSRDPSGSGQGSRLQPAQGVGQLRDVGIGPAEFQQCPLQVQHVVDIRAAGPARSEEHTSELQSREKLVCRLLLEIKR